MGSLKSGTQTSSINTYGTNFLFSYRVIVGMAIVSYSLIAAYLGPAESVVVWSLAGEYLALLHLPGFALFIFLYLTNPKARVLIRVIGPTTLGLVGVSMAPIMVGVIYCNLQGLPLGARPVLFDYQASSAKLAVAFASSGFVVALSEYASALGFPPRVTQAHIKAKLWPGHGAFFLFGLWAGQVSYFFPKYFILWVLLASIPPMVILVRCMYTLARITYRSAEEAKWQAADSLKWPIWSIQWTDLHLTLSGTQRAEGGIGGNEALKAWVDGAIAHRLQFAFVTGDLTDTGAEREWEVAKNLMSPLLTSGCRVLVAPGNHDLLSAYGDDALVSAHIRSVAPEHAKSYNGHRLRNYLTLTTEMDDSVVHPDCRNLAQVLKSEQDMFLSVWNEVELARVERNSKQEIDVILAMEQRIIALLGGNIFNTDWRTVLRFAKKDTFLQSVCGAWYSYFWYDYFPLKTIDRHTSTSFYILNSIPNDARLLESSWGYFGEKQIDRLRRLLECDKSEHLIILTHHACFRWDKGDPAPRLRMSDLQRWAALAMAMPDAEAFVQCLAREALRRKEVILLCGHRHGGEAMVSVRGSWAGGVIIEGASLAECKDSVMGVTWDSGGRIQIGRLSL